MEITRARPAGRYDAILLAFTALVGGLIGCSDSVTAPNTTSICGGGLVQLGLLQAATFDCSNGGTSITLGGGGASYLVVPQLVTDQAPNKPVGYTMGVSGGAVLSASASRGVSSRLELPSGSMNRAWGQIARGTPTPGRLQREFDAARRASDRTLVARGIRPSGNFLVQPPTLGSLQDFHVLATMDTVTPVTKRVTAALDYVGQNILIYVDTLAPPNGFSANQLNQFGQLFDQTLYPLDLNTFGSPSDIDQNGRVIMLLSPVVNALTPSSQCSTVGFVAGFFDGFDLVSSDTSSNRGEIFYSIVPDPNGSVSCTHTVSDLLDDVPSVFLHELQHLINFSQHVLVHQSVSEEGWLDEGLSLVASELGSLYYEQKFPPPTGRTDPNQLFPDSSQGFIGTQLASSYSYLLRPDTVTLTLHSDADGGLTWRGGDWLLLRWLGDQKGDGFYRQLEETALTGTRNIASAAGEAFPLLFGDFSLALYTDSLLGVPKSSIPSRDRFTTRTLRVLYQAYFNAAGPSGSVPQPFPITPTVLTGSVNTTTVPGTPTFYQINTASGASQVQVEFTAPGGSVLNASLHPQVSVFRLPT